MASSDSKTPPPAEPGTAVLDRALTELLSERYLAYALSTITSRSLPDVRDGLKPVQRRLLYAMRALGLRASDQPKKSARVVGDVMGKFHPHGDQAIYDALVRLAQEFAQRYPLVDGQGNFGNIDGDNAAAMRYTEARLTQVAERLLDGLDEDAIDFRDTYDGQDNEPAVLPGRLPNLLMNGTSGIAVGMATSIPPHNAAELILAARALLADRALPDAALLRLVPGPDFPTGGILVEPADTIAEAYRTGRGSFRLRARWQKETGAHGTWIAVVDQIPWLVPKSRLIERIAEALETKKLPLLETVRDESAEDVRLVLVPKSRNVEPAALMESLFRASELEVKIPLNLNVLDRDGRPGVMSLRQALLAFLDHRLVVMTRQTRHRLAKIERRLEIVAGLLIVHLNLDEVIRIIRQEDEPKPALIEAFQLTDIQAEHVLDTRLRSLRKLEEQGLKREQKDLKAEQKRLLALLADPKLMDAALDADLESLLPLVAADTVLGARRTAIEGPPAPVAEEAIQLPVEREPVTVILSMMGWVRALRGHGLDLSETKFKEGDQAAFTVETSTADRLLLAASNGKLYTLPVDRLPRGRGMGEPLRLMIDLPAEAAVLALWPALPAGAGTRHVAFVADDGRGFRTNEAELLAQTRAGRQVLTAPDGTKLALVLPFAVDEAGNPTAGPAHMALLSSGFRLLVLALADLPEIARGRGVILMRLKDSRITDGQRLDPEQGYQWAVIGRTRREKTLAPWVGPRGGTGRQAPNGFPRDNRFPPRLPSEA